MIAFIIMDPTRVDGRGPGPGISGGGPAAGPSQWTHGHDARQCPGRAFRVESRPGLTPGPA